ncbi:DNA cytosine methyltransferase [Chloroflexota bacterium]
MNNNQPTVFSLFSGGGGIDIGFLKAGYNVVYATDIWDLACQTLSLNNPNTVVECNDIRQLNCNELMPKLDLGTVDCIVGGPPCPPYSKSRFYLKNKKRSLEDEDSFTLNEYFRVVEELKPKVFFFENVFGFVYKPHREALIYLQKRSEELGYTLSHHVINCANYGVPQIRDRFICIGVKNSFPKFIFPEETHINPDKLNGNLKKKPWVTCREAIGDLDYPLEEDESMQAGSRHKELLKLVPPGDNYLYFTENRGYPNPIFKWRSRYWSFLLKLSPDKPSWTIQASRSNNMGPFHWSNRFLRIDEIKRIQTFDDDYQLVGNIKDQWRQIGNALPPLVAQLFAEAIKDQIFWGNTNRDLY